MSAILLREGFSGGASPTLQVLDCLPQRSKRDSGKIFLYIGLIQADGSIIADLLPNLPAFRKFFPEGLSDDVSFKPSSISLGDVECVTKTILKASNLYD